MKIKTTVHIYYSKYEWENEGEYIVSSHKFEDAHYRSYICEQEIEIEIPDNYDPRAQQIAALIKQKEKAMADYQNTLTEINERISKLQALEYTA